MRSIDMLVTGVGGQGTILASDIIGEVGMQAGYDVKKSDVLGLAVRGGSVSSHVRWDEESVNAPMASEGTIDYLISFEKLEAIRNVEYLKPEGTILVNKQQIQPVSVSAGEASYPDDDYIDRILRKATDEVHYFDALNEAEELGSSKTLNVVILGAFSNMLDVDDDIWKRVIKEKVPEKFVELNMEAFERGRKLI